MVKSTYGTGCFVLANTGTAQLASHNRLLTTLAWQLDGKRCYALEGSIFVAGSAVQWLRDGLGMIKQAEESEALAQSVADTAGVYLVPAFTGLGAPHWQPEARGVISGLTPGATRAHLVRATLEAMSYQTRDLLDAFERDGVKPTTLRIDGGMARNNWLAQDLADILDTAVERATITESTAWGAAMLASVGVSLHPSLVDAAKSWTAQRRFLPAMEKSMVATRMDGWRRAVRQALTQ
jgi:glycerol kinase